MKAKTPKTSAAMADGEHSDNPMWSASPNGNGNGSGIAIVAPGNGAAPLPDDRGMPGLQDHAPVSSMMGETDPVQQGEAHEMPSGGMKNLKSRPNGSHGGGGGGNDGSGGFGDGTGGDAPQVRQCATMDVHRRLLSTDNEYARMRDEVENDAARFSLAGLSAQRPGITRIPVVVHVVWNTPAQNISDPQIASQIDVLNRDFRRANADVGTTPVPFLPLATDARIEFFLATSSPSGAPATGIERRQTSVTDFTSNDAVKSAASGGMDAWPAAHYLNIWVCPLAGGLLGYAQFPGGPDATDGVVIRHSAFGTNGTAAAPFNLGRTATHEIGHWLNLNHIWGDDGTGCSGTDNVSDTPNQAGGNTGTPIFPHVSCSNGPHGDMFMNYMDYVDDRAMVMFSAGQVERMQACLDGVRSTIGQGAGAIRPSSSPAVAWGPNRLDTFVLGTDRALYHKWFNGTWSPSVTGYAFLGGTSTSVPQAASWGPNRLDVFVTGNDSALYHKWLTGTSWGPSATGYEYMGGVCVDEPRIVSWGPNRLDVFVLGTNRALFHKAWNGSAWSPSVTTYESLGGTCMGQPEVVSWGPNRLDIFVIGTDHALYHKWWDGASWGPSLTGYERLGGACTCAPRAIARAPNRLDVFVTGTDGALYRKWWNGTSWGPSADGFERLGGICTGQPEAVAWGPERIDVFVIGLDSGLYHKWWDGVAWGPSLTGYESLGGICTSTPRCVAWGPNRLDVFLTGTDSALYHKWWDGAGWKPSIAGYEFMGGTVSAFREEEAQESAAVGMPMPHAKKPSPMASAS